MYVCIDGAASMQSANAMLKPIGTNECFKMVGAVYAVGTASVHATQG